MSLTTVQTTVSQLTRRVTAGVANGTLNAAEAQQFEKQLADIQGWINADAFDGNGFTWESWHTTNLSALSTQLTAKLRDPNQNFLKRIEVTERRVDGAVTNGSLTPVEGQALKRELAVDRRLVAGASLGGLSSEEKIALDRRLDSIDTRISAKANDSIFFVAKRLEVFGKQIDSGVATGTLTGQEAQQLRNEVAAMRQIVSGAQLDGRLDGKERQALDVRMDQLGARIAAQRTDADFNVAVRRNVLTAQIDRQAAAGKLTWGEAQGFKHELNDLMRQQAWLWQPELKQALGARMAAIEARVAAEVAF